VTLNDIELTECYIRAKQRLVDVNTHERAGNLEGVRQAWEDIQALALKAGYRCNDLRFNRVPKATA
jgi:hypothetical protein